MCGRYTLTATDTGQLGERFGAIMPEPGAESFGVDEGSFGRFNVAPTESIAVVVVGKTGEREAHRVRWGLVPGYAKSLKGGPPMFNARSETIAEKRAVQGPAGQAARPLPDPRRRLLRVAAARRTRRATRVPFRFTVDGGEPFAFAGLWGWSKPEGEWLASARRC